jgi:hypothetical protein
MSTLSIPAPSRPTLLSRLAATFSRLGEITVATVDAVAEARRLADEAQRRHPFVR